MQKIKVQNPINALLSIICTTFNHEKYIIQTIESFLMQKTTFIFNIVIHDDASTDNTKKILKSYQEKYPHIIKLILQQENQYSKKEGNLVARFVLPSIKAKYIAKCEGDDYWTDPYKLQKQVDFLENNTDFSASTHQTTVILKNNQTRLFKKNTQSVYSLNDLLTTRVFHTASIVFHTKIIKENSFAKNITSGDRALFFLLASKGKINFFQDSMAIYRKHAGGISSWISIDLIKKDMNIIPWISAINPDFPKNKYKSFIYKTIFTYPTFVGMKNVCQYYLLYLIFSFSYFPKNILPLIKFTLKELPLIIKNNINKKK